MKLRTMTSVAALCAALVGAAPTMSHAASHREAPLIAFDPAADITDVYAFVSYDDANIGRPVGDRRLTLIMNVIPGQDPADGPNYFAFDDDVLYSFHIDNNADGQAEDISYEVRFKTETRPIGGTLVAPLPFIGGNITGGIQALDGPGSEGLTRRQTYTVTEVRGNKRTKLFSEELLVAVPSNIGDSTTPNYEDLASEGVYEDGEARVFAGQRAETFYIDLGAVFDTVNLRRNLPLLTAEEDGNDAADPFGVNRFSGTNINTIALELPIDRVTGDMTSADQTVNPIIGVYASTSRQKHRRLDGSGDPKTNGKWVQVARMANPLVNELIIDTPSKDKWNATDPEDEAQFQNFYQNPTLAVALEILTGVMTPDAGRTDLMSILLKYPGQALGANGSCGNPCSELLRLDVSEDPTPADQQSRLGSVLGGDPAGFPNGRRPNDDVTDIATRVVGGANFINARVGDGVNFLADAPGAGTSDGTGYGLVDGNLLDVTANGIAKEFPFLPTPHEGRDRQHIDCDEPGANACN
jgi:hypothetical protein